MMLNRKDTILGKNNIENFVDELYQINNKDIEDDDLGKVLDTALFEKKEDDFSFFHKSIQEYLTAYFINYKELSFEKIKEIFAHDLRFYEEFEEVIIYLTNMQSHLFDDFIAFDPAIFRRHPSLTEKQKEKLLSSILDKLQNDKLYALDREDFFYYQSFVKFDEIDICYIIEKKDIENNQNKILVQYIMRLFIENYSEKLEDFIFKIFSTMLDNKERCRDYIEYGYHLNQDFNWNSKFIVPTDNKNPDYSIKLFNFMKKNKLFTVEDNNSEGTDFTEHTIEIYLFYILAQQKEKYGEEILYLINYLNSSSFPSISSYFPKIIELLIEEKSIDISIIGKWFNSSSKFEIDTQNSSNIGYLIKILLKNHEDINSILKNLIIFGKKCNSNNDYYQKKYERSIPYRSSNEENESPLFYVVSDKFWNIYFSSEIQNFSEVSSFLYNYSIQTKDIEPIIEKYPIEDYFKKIFPFIDILEDNKKIFPLAKNQQTKLLTNLKAINNIHEDKKLIGYIFKLLSLSYSDELENFVFEILEHFVKEKEICREYIDVSYNSEDAYNIRLFKFMKENNLFSYLQLNRSDEIYPNIEKDLFNKLKDVEYQKILAPYIGERLFFNSLKDIKIKDIEKWFDYLCENRELLEDSFEYKTHGYKCRIGWIAHSLLTRNNLDDTLLKKIIACFINTKLELNDYFINYQPLFYTISKEFWNIYFNDKVKSFEEIESFISLYNITIKDIESAKSEYHISDTDKKYIDLYAFIHSKIPIEELKVEYENLIKENNLEKNWLNIFTYALRIYKNPSYLKLHEKLEMDLGEQYNPFMESIENSYFENKELLKIKDNTLLDYKGKYAYITFLFYIFPFDELRKFITTKKAKKDFFYWIIIDCIYITDSINEFIEENFDIFLDVVIEYIKLSIKGYSEKEKNNFLFSLNKYSTISPTKLINFLVELKDSEFKLFEDKFLEIIALNVNQYDFIKKKITANNYFTYLPYLLTMDINKALEDFYKDTYDQSPKKDKKNLFEKLVNNLELKLGLNKVNIADVEEIYIKKILHDYYEFFDDFNKKEVYSSQEQGYNLFNQNNRTKIIPNIWNILYDEKYKNFLEELEKSENEYISASATYILLELYNKKLNSNSDTNDFLWLIDSSNNDLDKQNEQNREIDNESYKEIFDNYKKTKNRFFNYEKLRDDLIEISLTETKNRNAIFKDSEDETNDRFRNALQYKKYNISDQPRGGDSSSGINAGNRDLVIRNSRGLDESIIEALQIKEYKGQPESLSKKLKIHYEKLVKLYDTSANEVNFVLIYSKVKNFDELWNKYIEFDGFENFVDTQDEYSQKDNIRVGVSEYKRMKVYHLFINFYSYGGD